MKQSIAVTQFKIHCLALIDQVAQKRVEAVVLLKHNKPVATLIPFVENPISLHGVLKGSVIINDLKALTTGTHEKWEAEQ